LRSTQNGAVSASKAAIREFGDGIEQNLLSTASAEHRVRGLRAESLFLSVVASIGKVRLIKMEDNGEVFFSGDEEIGVPDFRVVTDEGRQILVEVKVHPSEGTFNAQFKVSDGSLRKLRRYAAVSGAELYVAIFWEGINSWTLNRLEAFSAGTRDGNH
jgi:hypothetical protein